MKGRGIIKNDGKEGGCLYVFNNCRTDLIKNTNDRDSTSSNNQFNPTFLDSETVSPGINWKLKSDKEFHTSSNTLKSLLNKKASKPTTKVPQTRPKRIKRCSISLYGNRPSYGLQTLHKDLWE